MAFPEDPLGTQVEFQIGGTWTDVTQYALTADIITHTRGRQAEGQGVDPASCSVLLKSPNGLFARRNPRSPYFGLLSRNTPMRVSLQAGQQRLYLPDGTGNRISTPSVSALNLTGSLDVRIEVGLTNWGVVNSVMLCGKWTSTPPQRSWLMFVGTGGELTLRLSLDGTATLTWPSTVPIPVPSSGRIALRSTWDNAAGTFTHYTAPSISGPWTQLGDTVTGFPGTLFANTTALQIGAIDQTTIHVPPVGSVYAFELRNGIGGPIVAGGTDFTALAIGTTSFVDTAGRTWSFVGDAAITNKRIRFSGEYSDWPTTSSRGGHLIKVTGEGAGILRRLNQGKKPLASTLRRRIPSFAPVAYWPMEEGSDATQAYSPIANVRPLTATALDWAADDTLPGSSPLPVVQVGASFVAPVPPIAPGTWQVELVYNLDTMPVALTTLFEVRTSGTARRVRARVATNNVVIDGLDGDDNTLFTGSVTAPQFNAAWNRLQIRAVQSGGSVTYSVRWLIIGGTGFATSQTITASPGFVTDVRSSFGTGLDGMRFGHLAVFSQQTDTPFNGADQAFNRETAAARLLRLSSEESLPISVAGIQSETALVGPQRTNTLLEQLEQAADADGGLLVEDRERLGLHYRSRRSMYGQTPVLTLSYGSKALGLIEPVDDDMDIRNDITVERIGGSSGRAELTEGALSVADPPDGIGRYDDSVSLNLADDSQAEPMAWWLVALGTWDEARYPTITIRLHRNPALIPTILSLTEGDLIRITDLPDWLPPGPIDLLVVGYTERLGTRTWEVDLVCVPAGPYQVGVIEGSTTGRVDANPGGSLLAAAASAVATALVVHTPGTLPAPAVPWIASSGPAPTYAGDFPIPALVAGEQVSVSAIRPWAYDAFGRTVAAGGWGTATDGQAWALAGGSNSDRSVNGSRGVVTLASSATTVRFQTIPGAVGDCEIRCRMSASAVATGAALTQAVLLRYVDASNYYSARLHFGLSGAMQVSVTRAGTIVGSAVTLATTYAATDEFEVRVRLTGHLVQMRVWPVGSQELAMWHVEQTVSTSPIASGLVGTAVAAVSGNTNSSPALLVDEFAVPTPQAWTVVRSGNGVIKSQSAGAEVRVVRPAVVAL
ncbi:hypothetical protein [Streptomyces sp. NPDC001076]